MTQQETTDALQVEALLWRKLQQARKEVDAANERSHAAYERLCAELTPAQRALALVANNAESEVLGATLSHNIAALKYALPHVASQIDAQVRNGEYLEPEPPLLVSVGEPEGEDDETRLYPATEESRALAHELEHYPAPLLQWFISSIDGYANIDYGSLNQPGRLWEPNLRVISALYEFAQQATPDVQQALYDLWVAQFPGHPLTRQEVTPGG